MGMVRVALDQHTLDRLEALALLRRELDPRCGMDASEALRQAVERGLDLLLCEALAEPAAPGNADGLPGPRKPEAAITKKAPGIPGAFLVPGNGNQAVCFWIQRL